MQKILFITGTANQTSQMHQIARHLPEFDCWFSPLFSDSRIVNYLINKTRLLNRTVLSPKIRLRSEAYLRQHHLQTDYRAAKNNYDLIVYCSDLVIAKRFSSTKKLWVQEGMIDRPTFLTKMVKTLKLPPILTGDTSLNGSNNTCDIYCAASAGYGHKLVKSGTQQSKIRVTGIPNYDNIAQYLNNSFPHRDYVMVATTDMRETLRFENRQAFIRKAVKIAKGRQLLFKLHPNENLERARKEILNHTPANTLVYTEGNTFEMIANCAELITRYSTVVYAGIVLGKKVHSNFNIDDLERLTPMQNNGTSAQHIAALCSALISSLTGDKLSQYPK